MAVRLSPLVALLALLVPGVGAAEPGAALRYERLGAAHDCPDREVLVEAIHELVGAAVIGDGDGRTITVVVGLDGEESWAHIEVRRADGEPAGARELVAEQHGCERLFSAVADFP